MQQLTQEHWEGTALVVGAGGIGAAVASELKQRCPKLSVLTAGRQGPPDQTLRLDLEADQDLAELAGRLTESCRAVDPSSTDETLTALELRQQETEPAL